MMILPRLGDYGNTKSVPSKFLAFSSFFFSCDSNTHHQHRWGYLQTGSGVPEDQLPLISRTIDVDYSALICRDAFNLTQPADVAYINRLGGFNISYPRLAFIDGEWDPWRAAGVHAIGLPERTSTTEEPYILIAVSSSRCLFHFFRTY